MCDPQRLSRRDLLRGAMGAAGFLVLPRGVGAESVEARIGSNLKADRPVESDIEVALRAERWIRASRTKTPGGIAWPVDPVDAASVARNLYSGTPGIVLFLLELHHATGVGDYLDEARAGAGDLLANLRGPQSFDGGLYTGVAGRGFVLAETWRATGEKRFRDGALRAVDMLRENAIQAGAGVEWSDSADMISGVAGIMVFLLYSSTALGADRAIDLAAAAGRRLAELGRPDGGGLKWAISPRVPNLYPNFSHGTAGAAYALASLYGVTREGPLLEAALAGTAYLERVALRENDACRVFHHEPGGSDLFYLSWCHGGAGTARLFYRLADVTGDESWLDRVHCHARGVTALGAPVERSPGYWNNVSQCCGNAGVGEFFLSLHRLFPDRGYLAVARAAADDTLDRASAEGSGLKWVQAEHRVRPELLVAQTGRMQGAAGVGSFFLRLDGYDSGRQPGIVMPDSPWV